MAETSPFAGCPPATPAAAGATVAPVGGLATVAVTAWDAGALAEAVRARFGLTLPENGRWTEHHGLLALWTAPGQWWLQRADADLFAQVAPLADHAALIDISHARATVRIAGPQARTILMSLLPLDLHPRAFAPGRVAATVAAHLTVQVRQIDTAPSYEMSCLRSFARSLWRALELAGGGALRMEPPAPMPP